MSHANKTLQDAVPAPLRAAAAETSPYAAPGHANGSVIQRQQATALEGSARVREQGRFARALQDSQAMVAQRQCLHAVFGPAAQAVAQPKRGRRRAKQLNPKQEAQRERLLARWERRRLAAQERLEALESRFRGGLKAPQLQTYQNLPSALQQRLRDLFGAGFAHKGSAGRAVFTKDGDFAACKAAAAGAFGGLGDNREDGVATYQGATGLRIKERYMTQCAGFTVIVRNFSSDQAINGTIEIQTDPQFEFKYQ